MRLFIALEVPESNQQQLKVVQNELKRLLPQAKLTDNDKLHLTLAFLGEQPEDLIPALKQLLQNAIVDIPSFTVTPSYIDGFPNLHHANILWTGVKGDIDKIFLIRERLKDGLGKLNLPTDERRFIPHIAIAKTDNLKLTQEDEEALQKIAATPLDPIHVSSIKLFESIPHHGLHSHNTLAEIQLVDN